MALLDHVPDHPGVQAVAVASFVPVLGSHDPVTIIFGAPMAVYYALLTVKLVTDWWRGNNATGHGQPH